MVVPAVRTGSERWILEPRVDPVGTRWRAVREPIVRETTLRVIARSDGDDAQHDDGRWLGHDGVEHQAAFADRRAPLVAES